jgi:hypothetical protein
MSTPVFWAYLAAAVLLILHEMDSAFWKEWQLFKLPGGVGFFLVLHIPLYVLLLLGLAWLAREKRAGLWVAAATGAAGIAAGIIHGVFLRRGHKEFSTFISRAILYATSAAGAILLGLAGRGLLK